MASEKALAIVLRVVDFSESSCVVTLFTREFGKIGALAKGARRPKSAFDAALDVLAVCRIVFLKKSADVLDLLTEAKLARRFRSAQKDLTRLYAGYYVAELLNELTDNGDPYPDLFDWANESLLALDGRPKETLGLPEGTLGLWEEFHGHPGRTVRDGEETVRPPGETDDSVARIVLRFELAALRILGHLPTFDVCAGCGDVMPSDAGVADAGRVPTRIAFGLLAGGVLCANCRVGQRKLVSVTSGAIKIMQTFADADSNAWRNVSIDARVRGEVRGLMNHYFANMMGRRPKMQQYLSILAR